MEDFGTHRGRRRMKKMMNTSELLFPGNDSDSSSESSFFLFFFLPFLLIWIIDVEEYCWWMFNSDDGERVIEMMWFNVLWWRLKVDEVFSFRMIEIGERSSDECVWVKNWLECDWEWFQRGLQWLGCDCVKNEWRECNDWSWGVFIGG